jgi:two-component system OmpR family sensor kinase
VTLRARLLLGLIFIAAIGTAITSGVVYRQQHDFLIKQVNTELNSAVDDTTLQDSLLSSLGTGARVHVYAPIPLAAAFYTQFGTGYVSTSKQPPVLPNDANGYFTLKDARYRGIGTPRNIRGNVGLVVVAVSLHDMDESLHHLLLVEILVACLVLFALALMGWWVVKLGLRPLQDMERTAGAIAAGDLSQRVEIVDPNTEVGRLGIAMNEMLQQIEAAFSARAASEARLRRFVGDASHELRTPLTSIRGYAELFRRGAADRPEDLAKAMRRIEEEANRMGVLVDDMLLLARLDQGRPLERQPVDLTRIARDAVDDFRAVSPERPIDFAPAGSVFVPGDEARLRQVLGNLLQNARRHTPPDTPVHVRVYGGATDAVIEVADEGPGMEAEDASRVFERFWRSDPSRARASGGAGLGLAIVAAIADAHGGRAEVQTAPGHGATFRVRLPLNAPVVPEQRTPNGSEAAPPSPTPADVAPPQAPPDAAPAEPGATA